MNINVETDAHIAKGVSVTAPPRYLDFVGALAKIRELGFNLTKSQLRERQRRNELPFFKDGAKLYISENALVMHYHRKQLVAEKKVNSNGRN
jgi:hypothetical protein